MNKRPWYERLADDWHIVAYTLLFLITVVVYVLHFLSPALGEALEPFLSPANLLIVILMFVAVIAAQTRRDGKQLSDQLSAVQNGLLSKADLGNAINCEIGSLANVRFYSTKEETFRRLTAMTMEARQLLMATRFSPGDIISEAEYWKAVKERALDSSILSIRIHSLAHRTRRPVEVIGQLIEQFKGAQGFTLGIALFGNESEMIVSDGKEAIFCFHEFDRTIRNGVHFDSRLPSSEAIVASFDDTFRSMLFRCYVEIPFDTFVRSDADVADLQAFVRKTHLEYCAGSALKRPDDMEDFLREQVFVTSNREEGDEKHRPESA